MEELDTIFVLKYWDTHATSGHVLLRRVSIFECGIDLIVYFVIADYAGSAAAASSLGTGAKMPSRELNTAPEEYYGKVNKHDTSPG